MPHKKTKKYCFQVHSLDGIHYQEYDDIKTFVDSWLPDYDYTYLSTLYEFHCSIGGDTITPYDDESLKALRDYAAQLKNQEIIDNNYGYLVRNNNFKDSKNNFVKELFSNNQGKVFYIPKEHHAYNLIARKNESGINNLFCAMHLKDTLGIIITDDDEEYLFVKDLRGDAVEIEDLLSRSIEKSITVLNDRSDSMYEDDPEHYKFCIGHDLFFGDKNVLENIKNHFECLDYYCDISTNGYSNTPETPSDFNKFSINFRILMEQNPSLVEESVYFSFEENDFVKLIKINEAFSSVNGSAIANKGFYYKNENDNVDFINNGDYLIGDLIFNFDIYIKNVKFLEADKLKTLIDEKEYILARPEHYNDMFFDMSYYHEMAPEKYADNYKKKKKLKP